MCVNKRGTLVWERRCAGPGTEAVGSMTAIPGAVKGDMGP